MHYKEERACHWTKCYLTNHSYFLPPQDSYALCRVFKKTTQIPKAKEEEINGNADKELAWLSDDNVLGDDSSSNNIDISQEREAEYEQKFNNEFTKFPSDTSSSDVTQGTPIETGPSDYIPAPFSASDEANSSANLYLPNADYSSNIFQVCSCIMCHALKSNAFKKNKPNCQNCYRRINYL